MARIRKNILSPNKCDRQDFPIEFIIIHDTETDDCNRVLKWFTMPESKVSAHFVIAKDGIIQQLVSVADVAWHAGQCNVLNCNFRSIGIELVNRGDGKDEFPEAQMNSLKDLVLLLGKQFHIDSGNVLGHNEIAPSRKKDPHKPFDIVAFRGWYSEEMKKNP